MKERVKLRWKHFKAFADTGDISIKPITILLGANGSGKTSLIQPLLLLRQTMESAEQSIPLMMKGSYLNAGTFGDTVHNHDKKRHIELNFDFAADFKEPKKSEAIGVVPPSKINLSFSNSKEGMPQLQQYRVQDLLSRLMLSRTLKQDGKYSVDKFYAAIASDRNMYKLIMDQKPNKFAFDDMDIIRNGYMFNESSNKKAIRFSKPTTQYISVISFMGTRLSKFLSSLKYVGPIREYPQRFYEFSGEYHPEVGPKGQYTYSLLYKMMKDHGKMKILNQWLRNFQLAKSITCRRLEKRPDLLEIKVTPYDCNLRTNYADSCFGVSQILPLLVQCLMSEKRDVIISEQPEIHLNPQCETTLADLFVNMVKTSKLNFIVETHSEHYLMRLRTHIKKGNINHDDVAIYYSECGKKGKALRQILFDSDGNYTNANWPLGFFNQAISESLMFATAKRK